MNESQKQQILDSVAKLESIALKEKLVEAYPKDDLSQVFIHEGVTAAKAIYLQEAIVRQFRLMFKSDDWPIYPSSFNWPPIDSTNSYTISQRINEIFSYASQKNLEAIIPRFLWLIYYLQFIGYWGDRGKQDEGLRSTESVEALAGLLEAKSFQLERLSASLRRTEEEIKAFQAQKQAELQSITNSLGTVQSQQEAINGMANSINQIHGAIKEQSKSSESLVMEFSETLKKQKAEIKVLSAHNEKEKESIAQYRSLIEGFLSKSEDEYEEIKSKKAEINKLLGLAADGALGQWFGNRHESLTKRVRRWQWAVVAAALVAGGWAVLAFWLFGEKGANPFLNLGVNAVKTIPFFVLLFWVLRQYSRERLMEEEYAFRAAISKTIKTYSDMLEKADQEDNKTRNEMLREVLQQIYSMPRIHPERAGSMLRLRSKDLKEILKDLKESVKGKD